MSKNRCMIKQDLISKGLIDSNISHDGFVLVNDVLKEAFKNPGNR